MFLILLFFLTHSISHAATQNCSTCVNSGNLWCLETSECNSTFASCQTQISLQLNCPTIPDPKYAYVDDFMRTQQLTLASASHGDQIQSCFDNQIPTMKLFKSRTVNCSTDSTYVSCVGFTAYDVSQQVIVLSFRGVHEQNQAQQLNDGYANEGLQSYFGVSGKMFKITYDLFMLLWNGGGMQQDLRSLKYKYPEFKLWINGHSLGGMFSWIAATFIVTNGLYTPENIKVATMATPRLFDYDFAVWFTTTFPYSYHIVHRLDPIPRSNQIDPHTNTTVMFHPRTEVWYDNFMNQNDTYQICEEADGDYCSAAVTENLDMWDHIYYFNVAMPAWGRDGCPNNRTAYAQTYVVNV